MSIVTSHEEATNLKHVLAEAKKKVNIGGKYRHYKSRHKIYTVIDVALMEESTTPVVLYKNDEGLLWVRYLHNFLEPVEYEGKTSPRFSAVHKVS